MSNITRFDPFHDLTRFEPFGDFDSLFKGFMVRPLFQGAPAAPQMKLEVTEDDKAYTVKAEIPGVKKEDIHISLSGNLMTINGETKTEEKEEQGDYYRCDISRGSFSRTVVLPADVDDAKAKAEMRDGMLEITLPKIEQAEKRDIKVS